MQGIYAIQVWHVVFPWNLLTQSMLGYFGSVDSLRKNPHDVQSHLLMSSLTLETYAGNVILTGVHIL